MKRLLIVLSVVLAIVCLTSISYASCMVSGKWTPSPNAVSEKLLVDEAPQSCPEAGKCDFIVPELLGQRVEIRSFNSQGEYVTYEAATLDKENLSDPASGFTFTIICSDN